METKTSLAEKFAQLYYAEVDPEELAARDPADLHGAAAAHLAFGRRYGGGEAKLRAYNPVHGEHGWASTHTALEIVLSCTSCVRTPEPIRRARTAARLARAGHLS